MGLPGREAGAEDTVPGAMPVGKGRSDRDRAAEAGKLREANQAEEPPRPSAVAGQAVGLGFQGGFRI